MTWHTDFFVARHKPANGSPACVRSYIGSHADAVLIDAVRDVFAGFADDIVTQPRGSALPRETRGQNKDCLKDRRSRTGQVPIRAAGM